MCHFQPFQKHFCVIQFPVAFAINFSCCDVTSTHKIKLFGYSHCRKNQTVQALRLLAHLLPEVIRNCLCLVSQQGLFINPAVSVHCVSRGSVPAELPSPTCLASCHCGRCGRGKSFVAIWNYFCLSNSMNCWVFFSLLNISWLFCVSKLPLPSDSL